eukprot:TRINITY_DN23822_c0_g1_i1.p1 TRINITY_DN23822_c0_g1~~TRINITY_DN23822_c0_g1_i1.p1  ORF type:complete len:1044 (-),score=273.40 TRINITY_DN23822_c0_g1_i1:116-3247(-)
MQSLPRLHVKDPEGSDAMLHRPNSQGGQPGLVRRKSLGGNTDLPPCRLGVPSPPTRRRSVSNHGDGGGGIQTGGFMKPQPDVLKAGSADLGGGWARAVSQGNEDMPWRRQATSPIDAKVTFVGNVRGLVKCTSSAARLEPLPGDGKVHPDLPRPITPASQVSTKQATLESKSGDESVASASIYSAEEGGRGSEIGEIGDDRAKVDAAGNPLPGTENDKEVSPLLKIVLAPDEALLRFSKDGTKFAISDLSRLLALMGRIGARETEVIQTLAAGVTTSTTMTLPQVRKFLEAHANWERVHVRDAFEKFGSGGKRMALKDIPPFMRSLGVMVTGRPILVEALARAGLSTQERMSFEGFLRFYEEYKTTFGFTLHQLKIALQAFKMKSEEHLMSDGQEMLIKVNDRQLLRTVLDLDIFGLWVSDYAQELFDFLEEGSHPKKPATLGEFLSWAALLMNIVMTDLYNAFMRKSAKGDMLNHAQLTEVMEEVGYSLLPDGVDEFLEVAEVRLPMNFHDFVVFAKACFEADGFREQEALEFTQLFRKFDHKRTGEVDAVGVAEMIKFLGYQPNHKTARQVVKRVDTNGTGTMDVEEFLRFLRLHREDLVAGMSKVERTHSGNGLGGRRPNGLEVKLEPLGERMTTDFMTRMQEMLSEQKGNDVALQGSAVAGDESVEAEKRRLRNANFPDVEVQVLHELYNKHCDVFTSKQDVQVSQNNLDLGGLYWLLSDLRISSHNKQRRDHLRALLKIGRENALEVGMEPGDLGGETEFTFVDVLFMLSEVLKDNEKEGFDRERHARKNTRFGLAEVKQFRQIFRDFCRYGQIGNEQTAQDTRPRSRGRPNSRGIRHSPLARYQKKQQAKQGEAKCDNEKENEDAPEKPSPEKVVQGKAPRMEVQDMMNLLSAIGVALTGRQEALLYEKASDRDYDQTRLDFADFLRVLQWMLDDNFAGINDKAEVLSPKTKSRRNSGFRGFVDLNGKVSMAEYKAAAEKNQEPPGMLKRRGSAIMQAPVTAQKPGVRGVAVAQFGQDGQRPAKSPSYMPRRCSSVP